MPVGAFYPGPESGSSWPRDTANDRRWQDPAVCGLGAACRPAEAAREHTWGDDLLAWELAPRAAGTRLTLRHSVKSPEWVPKVAAGWHLCLLVAQRLLDGQPIGPIAGRRAKEFVWDRRHDAYAAALGAVGTASPRTVTQASSKSWRSAPARRAVPQAAARAPETTLGGGAAPVIWSCLRTCSRPRARSCSFGG
ncbi:hypothetical protein SBBP1_260004 [Burkholderiales bacterium]|nr:hypothetical protein SBBP1_260004 [Burkholderiales bacterium]